MTPGSPGLMGALLIVIGLAFALLAIAVVLNRRDSEAKQVEETDEPAQIDSEEPEDVPEIPPFEVAEAQPDSVSAEAPELERDEPVRPPEPHPPSPRALLPVAELLREEVTGQLILRLGDQVIRSADDLQSEADRRRIQYASADLADWFKDLEVPARPRRSGGDRRRSAKKAEAAQPADPSRAEAGALSSSDPAAGAAPRPVNMIEAINAILDRQLAKTEGVPRAVRLVPDPTGGVRVLLGVKSYSLEELPDENIKSLIRQAVAEWEESQ
ncbi:MAG TPA: hypothetical protein VGA07_11160 [Anaerolineales bacterium]